MQAEVGVSAERPECVGAFRFPEDCPSEIDGIVNRVAVKVRPAPVNLDLDLERQQAISRQETQGHKEILSLAILTGFYDHCSGIAARSLAITVLIASSRSTSSAARSCETAHESPAISRIKRLAAILSSGA